LGSPAAADDLDAVLHDARQRFAGAFAEQCDRLTPSADDAVRVLHRMAGLGGQVGFPRVSARAAELEDLLSTGAMSRDDLLAGVAELRAAFASDTADPASAAPPVQSVAVPMTVLLVEDEPVQRAIIAAQLRNLGHKPVAVASGEEVVEAARKVRPDAILLDIELPGIDGYAACRLLKADPVLARIPVAFLTAHGTVVDRLTGLSLGADDFLTKPLDPRQLAMRLLLLLNTRGRAEGGVAGGVFTYEMFQRAASDVLRRSPCALALIGTPPDQAGDVAALTRVELRRRDLCGYYDRSHVVVLMPDLGVAGARNRIAVVVESCGANGIPGVYTGIAASDAPGARTLARLMKEADEALASAGHEKLPPAEEIPIRTAS
jgi:DNA-binding response OmpR family regulator